MVLGAPFVRDNKQKSKKITGSHPDLGTFKKMTSYYQLLEAVAKYETCASTEAVKALLTTFY